MLFKCFLCLNRDMKSKRHLLLRYPLALIFYFCPLTFASSSLSKHDQCPFPISFHRYPKRQKNSLQLLRKILASIIIVPTLLPQMRRSPLAPGRHLTIFRRPIYKMRTNKLAITRKKLAKQLMTQTHTVDGEIFKLVIFFESSCGLLLIFHCGGVCGIGGCGFGRGG